MMNTNVFLVVDGIMNMQRNQMALEIPYATYWQALD